MEATAQWQFGPFQLDLTSRCLWREGELVSMRPKTFEVLAVLVTRAGEVVTKEVLLDTVWPETAVSDTVLKVCLREIRQSLGDAAKRPTYVATVHRRGYQFIAEVEGLEPPDASHDLLFEVTQLLEREHRISYLGLKRQFNLDDEALEVLKEELIYAKRLAVDEDDRVLVWRESGDATSGAPAYTPPQVYTPSHVREELLTSRYVLEGERKQVTVLFCDLVGSMAIAEQIGPEQMHELLNRFFELSLDAIHRYDGTINQFLGDGFMALYGAPIALEDHAKRGVLAALALQRTLNASDLGQRYGVECRFRMGLNSGLVVVGSIGNHLRMDYSAIGDTTNLAARLQTLAKPGQIVISEPTSQLVDSDVRLEALPPAEVKGKSELVPCFRVLGVRPRRSSIARYDERELSPFVGRARELATFDALLAQVELGQGQVLGLVAEAGQGKSRLLYEFRQHLQDAEVLYLQGRCRSYGSRIPYHPIMDLVRHQCGIQTSDQPDEMIEKVGQTLQDLDMDVDELSPYLIRLLGISRETEAIQALPPAVFRAKMFDTLYRMSLNASRNRPLIIEVEDLHWLDQTSEAYLEGLVDHLPAMPILLLTTYRPGYRPPWLEKSYVTQLSLGPLTSQDALTVVKSSPTQQVVSEPVTQAIIEKAQGNPFFLEELTRMVVDRDEVQEVLAVPSTIQGVLMARIDRLPESSKRLLQTASVLGREFSRSLIGAVEGETEALEPLLQDLKRLEFFYERMSEDEPTYVFKHALTQDVAYESLLTTHRQGMHAQAGVALEQLHAASPTEYVEELAHHFTLGEVWEKAFDYLVKSGDKARRAFASQEAVGFYTQAIEVSGKVVPDLEAVRRLAVYEGRGLVRLQLTQLDDAIADFQMMRQLARVCGDRSKEGASLCRLARAHQMTFSEEAMPFVESYAQAAFELAQNTGDRQTLAMSLTELGHLDAKQGDLPAADRKFETALEISRADGHQDALVLLLFALSRQANWQGDFHRAIEFGQEGVAISREIHDGNNELTNSFFLGLSCWGAGRYAQAFSVIHEALDKAKARRNQLNIIRLTNTLGWFYREFGDLTRALEYDHESVEQGRTHSLPDPEISALINLGLDYLALDQHEQAYTYLEPTLQRVENEAFGVHRWRWRIRLFIGLAEWGYVTGAYDQALYYVEEGLQEAHATSSLKYVALGLTLRDKIRTKLGEVDRVGADVRRAFRLAKQLGSPSLIYRVAYDVGQWHERRGQEESAAVAYAESQAAIDRMMVAIEDENLEMTLRRSPLVKTIAVSAARLGGTK